jgi:guanylate kinase
VNPFPIILSAPSGGGKTAIGQRIRELRPDIGYSVSCTTRRPRAGEVDGRDYYFLSTIEFEGARERGEFAESAEVHGKLYGTLRREVERVLASGRHVLMDIDVQGAAQFRRVFPRSVLVFVLPPSTDVLIARLRARKTENASQLALRLESAVKEVGAAPEYEYVLVNDELDRAVRSLSAIIDAESVRRDRMEGLDGRIAELTRELRREIDSQQGS